MTPIISVIIPTYQRPILAKRAAYSVLHQTYTNIEVIIVIDGGDPSTEQEFDTIQDPRLRVLSLKQNKGGAGARNAGVEIALGEWIAFLDDDDEWLPEKLSLQLDAALRSSHRYPVVSCRFIARTPTQQYLQPRRIWSDPEPLSEYLLARNTLFYGEGVIQTSTLFVPRVLIQDYPFDTCLKRHQDWDWLLRVFQLNEVGFEFVDQPLSIRSLEEGRKTVSSTSNWQHSRQWIRDHRDLVTRRAYASFLMVEVSHQAAQQNAWLSVFPILWEAIVRGRPNLSDFMLFFSMWLIPQSLRQRCRDLIAGRFHLNFAFKP